MIVFFSGQTRLESSYFFDGILLLLRMHIGSRGEFVHDHIMIAIILSCIQAVVSMEIMLFQAHVLFGTV